jgi:hypothetical protein
LKLRLSQMLSQRLRLPLERSSELPQGVQGGAPNGDIGAFGAAETIQESRLAAVVLMTTTLVAVLSITAVCLAMTVAIDSVAVLVSIRAMIVRPTISRIARIR